MLQLFNRELVFETHKVVNVLLEHLTDMFMAGGLVPFIIAFNE